VRVLAVAADILREAAARKWVLALGIGITVLLTVVASALRLEVVDGALSATRLFGADMNSDIRSVDVAMRPVFTAAAYLVFYGGLVAGIIACADFGPALLAPGRIEHLLAQPVHRWELVAGTFLGVLVLVAAGALYGAGGFSIILGLKTGVWTAGPLLGALLAICAFIAVYGPMLAVSIFVRSASLSAITGAAVLVAGILAGMRQAVAVGLEAGWARASFLLVTAALPRLSRVGIYAGDLAGSRTVEPADLARHLVGSILFGLGALAVGIWHFERKDF
jgi:Cu-processing system permease protein